MFVSRYKKYVLLDPLGVVTKTRSTFEDTDEGLADAPSTIVQREELNRQVAENYFFVPGMGHVPEIAVPDFLPDLLGSLQTGISCTYHGWPHDSDQTVLLLILIFCSVFVDITVP